MVDLVRPMRRSQNSPYQGAFFGMNNHSMPSLASASLSAWDWNSSLSPLFTDANVEALSDISFPGRDLRLANLRKASKKASTVRSSTTSRWIALVVAQVTDICRPLFQFQRFEHTEFRCSPVLWLQRVVFVAFLTWEGVVGLVHCRLFLKAFCRLRICYAFSARRNPVTLTQGIECRVDTCMKLFDMGGVNY